MRTKGNRDDAVHWGSLVSGVVWLTVFSLFAGKFAPALFSDRSPTDGWEKVPCLIQSAEVERCGVLVAAGDGAGLGLTGRNF